MERKKKKDGKDNTLYLEVDDITIVGQKYCNKEQKTICLCNVSFFIFIEKSAGL